MQQGNKPLLAVSRGHLAHMTNALQEMLHELERVFLEHDAFSAENQRHIVAPCYCECRRLVLPFQEANEEISSV